MLSRRPALPSRRLRLVALARAAFIAGLVQVLVGSTADGAENGQLFLATQIDTGSSFSFGATSYSTSTNQNQRNVAIPVDIRVTDAYVVCDASPSAAVQFQLRRSPLSTTPLCTVPTTGAPACAVSGLAVDFLAAEELVLNEVTAVSAAINCRVTLAYTLADGGAADAIVAGGGLPLSVSGTRYCGGWGATGSAPSSSWSCDGLSANGAALLMPGSAEVSGLTVRVISLPDDDVEAFTLFKRDPDANDTTITFDTNPLEVSATVVAAAGLCSADCSVAAADRVVLQVDQSGTAGSSPRRWAVSFDGVGALAQQVVSDLDTTTRFSGPMYANDGGSGTTVVAQPVARTSYARNLRVRIDADVSAAATVTLFAGAAPGSLSATALTCTTGTGSGTTCADTDPGHITTLNAGDYFAVAITGGAVETGVDLHWAFEMDGDPPPTPTGTATSTPTDTATSTPTATDTATATATGTDTPTASPSATVTDTPTATVTATDTATATNTTTATPTASATSTPTATDTATATPTVTSTATATDTATATPTDTASSTPTATATATPTPTVTSTATATATATVTPADTATSTATETSTSTATPTATSTQTAIDTASATPTDTATPTATATATPSNSSTATPSGTATATTSATATSTGTASATATPTVTATPALPQLSLSLLSPASVQVGQTVVYTIAYANRGGGAATGVLITEVVPPSTRFRAAPSDPGWSCPDDSGPGTACLFAVGDLGPGQSGTVQFAVLLVSPPEGGAVGNTATIVSDQGSQHTATVRIALAAAAPAASLPACAAGLLLMMVTAARRLRRGR